MTKPYMSQSGYIGVAKQTASGTYVTPAQYMYVDSISIDAQTEELVLVQKLVVEEI